MFSSGLGKSHSSVKQRRQDRRLLLTSPAAICFALDRQQQRQPGRP